MASAAEVASRTPISSPAARRLAPAASGNRISQAAMVMTPAPRRPAAKAWPASPKPMKQRRGVLRVMGSSKQQIAPVRPIWQCLRNPQRSSKQAAMAAATSARYGRAMRILRLLLPILLMLISGGGFAQSSANLSGTVTSDEGNALAGVSVTLTGPDGPAVRKTNESGQFRFLGLAPGDYHVSAKHPGFGDVTLPPMAIKAGQNAVDVRMSPAL